MSNFEVGFHMIEMSRIHKPVRRTRVHCSRGDSARNESERMNVCIGEELANDGTVKWQYVLPLGGELKEEVEAMTI